MVNDQVAVIILAAGLSSRFYSSKMNHELSNGKSILQNTIEKYSALFSNITVVVNQKSMAVVKPMTGIDIVVNLTPSKGMSHSLMVGIQAQSQAKSWLIALGDMPYLDITTLESLAERASFNKIILPKYEGVYGHPVIFGGAFKHELLSLNGDRGAKSVVLSNKESVHTLNTNDKGVLHDIDTVSDIKR